MRHELNAARQLKLARPPSCAAHCATSRWPKPCRGCAGMAALAARLSQLHGLPVVDGVAAAVAFAEALVRLGLRTSKRGGYAAPLAKPYAGSFAAFAPL